MIHTQRKLILIFIERLNNVAIHMPPLNPHIRPLMDSALYPANMHSYKNVKFLEVVAANAQRHQADIYGEAEQPIDHYAYPKSHIRPPNAPVKTQQT